MIRGILVAAAIVVLAGSAQAHTVLTDKSIGVTMHIDPDDAPVAGRPSRFVLWFKDLDGLLQAATCRGTFRIERDGQALAAPQALFTPGSPSLVSIHTVTFPRPAVYQVVIEGAPEGPPRFPAFRISFNVRVQGDGVLEASLLPDPFFHVSAALAVILPLLGWGFWPRRKPGQT